MKMENDLIPVDILTAHGTLLTMDEEMRVIADGAVAVAGKRIVAVGEAEELAGRYRAAETIDARGMIVMPGLINTHTHSGDALFRGLVEDLALEEWLAKLWVVEGEFLRPETVAWG